MIGDQGTNDDVTLEICSDYKKTDCCKTPPLKSILTDDWSKGDTEKWKPRYFGDCKNKVYKVSGIQSEKKRNNSNISKNICFDCCFRRACLTGIILCEREALFTIEFCKVTLVNKHFLLEHWMIAIFSMLY